MIRAAASTFALGAAALTWSLVEARAYALRRFTVPVLAPGARPVKILHLSDLHMLPTDHRRIGWIQALAAEEPDLVFSTGDNLSHIEAVPAVLEAIDPLLDLPGAFVTGSNDYYLPVLKNPLKYLLKPAATPRTPPTVQLPARELVDGMASRGWINLDNQRAQVEAGGALIDLVGTGDAHINQEDYPGSRPLPDDAAVRIGVTHAPYERVLSRMVLDGVDLALAGHTHGGQVCVPGYGALVTNCDLDRRMAKGLHRWPSGTAESHTGADMWLHVSAGLGTSPFTPIRFACRPEASILTLVPTRE